MLQHLTLNSRANCLKKNDLCVRYKNKTGFGAADLGKILDKRSQGNAVKTLGSRPKRIFKSGACLWELNSQAVSKPWLITEELPSLAAEEV